MDIEKELLNSSLRGIISDMEIKELAEELSSELEDVLETAIEESKEELEEELEDLQNENSKLEREISDLKKLYPPLDSLRDAMTMEWVSENWEELQKFSDSGKSAASIRKDLEMYEYFSKMQIDAVEHVSKTLDEEITKAVLKMKHKRIILVGRAASGKDHMRKLLESRGFKYAVSYTTRPPRSTEEDGKDYFFLSEEEFKAMIEKDEFYEHVSFNSWYYGTTKEQFYNDDVFIMTPHGLSCVHPSDRKDSFVIFLDMDYDIRRERLSQRSDADTVERRLEADERDFSNFTDYDVRITNEDF